MLTELVNDSRACSIESVIDSSVTNTAKEGHTLETVAVESAASVVGVFNLEARSRLEREIRRDLGERVILV